MIGKVSFFIGRFFNGKVNANMDKHTTFQFCAIFLQLDSLLPYYGARVQIGTLIQLPDSTSATKVKKKESTCIQKGFNSFVNGIIL